MSGALPMVELGRGRSLLRLRVAERNADAFIVEGFVAVRGFSATAACDVSLTALHAWRSELAAAYDTLAGQARLSEGGLSLVVEAHGNGKVSVSGLFDSETGWGDGERAVLRFQLPPLDQTDLPAVIVMLDQAVLMPEGDEDRR